jgi:hypothetical protein
MVTTAEREEARVSDADSNMRQGTGFRAFWGFMDRLAPPWYGRKMGMYVGIYTL